MTEVENIKLAELEITHLIEVCHRQGLNYWQILDIFLRATCILHLKSSAEYQLKGGINGD